jgi:hypothetical protein
LACGGPSDHRARSALCGWAREEPLILVGCLITEDAPNWLIGMG